MTSKNHKTEWAGIESAPKDVSILVCGGTWYSDGGGDSSEDFPMRGVHIADWKSDGWQIGYGSRYDEEYWAEPKYWMPLPSPPDSEA